MKLHCTTASPHEYGGDLLVFFIPQISEEETGPLSPLVAGILEVPVRCGDFRGKNGETFLFYPEIIGQENSMRVARVIAAGLGEIRDRPAAVLEQLRLAAGVVGGQARQLQATRMGVVLPSWADLPADACAGALAEGLILGNYRYVGHKSKTEEGGQELKDIRFFCRDREKKTVRASLDRALQAGRAVCRARDMANEPGNFWTPAHFAGFARKLAKQGALRCRILEKQDMKKLGMGGILGVNLGSAKPPSLSILEYHAGPKKPTVLLVGKGLTFDSGGVSLKPAAGMEDMKYDMCGGAAVLCTMQAIAALRPHSCNVVAMVPSTDNMGGANAMKPGDVITHYNGKTSEVVNTDAEGRLILADALAYGVEHYKPEAVIDLATLTGAVIIGLGHHCTGLLSNNDALAGRILEAGEQCGEPLWRLPLGPEYSKQLESKVADLKNVGGKPAGTITGAAYLQEFVGETPWAHLDIAGTAWDFTEKSYVPKGPSGVAVRTLIAVISSWQNLREN